MTPIKNNSFWPETGKTLKLAFPIMAGQVSQMLMGITDTIMIGKIGTIPLAAAAFVNMLIHFPFVLGIGLMAAIAVQVSHAFGAKQPAECGESLKHGLLISVTSGLLMALLLTGGHGYYHLLGQPEEVIQTARPYLNWISWSLPFALVIMCLRNFSEGQSLPWQPFWIILSGVILNAVLNWIFIFGKFGVPAMGIEGAGIATFIARVITVIGLFEYMITTKRFKEALPLDWWRGLEWKRVKSLMGLGTPIGLQILLEAGAFGIATIMLGWISTQALAAHQIALTCAATAFMFPLGLSMAVTIRVGQCAGSGQAHKAKTVWSGALILGIFIMTTTALVFLIFGKQIASLFAGEQSVVALTTRLLIIAGIFQIFDGGQVISTGALRGLKDVRIPTGIAFIAYWVVALPLGYFLAFPMGMSSQGVWAGLAAGLAIAAVTLSLRFYLMETHLIRRMKHQDKVNLKKLVLD
ncbi:MAG: MATE family efflux transporter [Verrucomicrobiota bacterium]|nr:MATE family efflux transporter [Verrucomicrobiota bacterium]